MGLREKNNRRLAAHMACVTTTRYGPTALRLAALLLLPAAIAGCSGQSGGPPPSPLPIITAPPVAMAPSVSSAMATDALSDEHCQKATDGSWTYTAKLVNHNATREAFTVAIGLTKSTAVLDHALVVKTLGPGEGTDISSPGFGKDAPADGVDCGAIVSKASTQ